MRFMADGPSIPGELLDARDEGRVVFFCGAGVSRAKADLPNFLDLTQSVIERLEISEDGPASKLLQADLRAQKESGVSLGSLDRVFGLLERDFTDHDIEAAVASRLRSVDDPDLSAHKTLLRLAKSTKGHTRLVTTNFDRLFEASDESLPVWRPPKLPDLSIDDEFQGIVHLHGIVDDEYESSDGNGFVLSSSEFGHAYLADGWATAFIKSVLEKYIVVFVGYTADDPPVRYLLEALNKRSHSSNKMYSFHKYSEGDAQTAWASKGVEPIVFKEYVELWETLHLWAQRAQDPGAWKQSVLIKAQVSPSVLEPFERGQVAHIVSTVEGMRTMSRMQKPLPAEWLYVFDPSSRLKGPSTIRSWDGTHEKIFPFERYSLDEDVYVTKEATEGYSIVPPRSDIWDCFKLMDNDKKGSSSTSQGRIIGYEAHNIPSLSRRLSLLGDWMVKVAENPIIVLWAVKKGGLHPEVIDKILFRFRSDGDYARVEIWQDLARAWKEMSNVDVDVDESYDLEKSYQQRPWTEKSIFELIEYYRPSIKVETLSDVFISSASFDTRYNLRDALIFEIQYQRVPTLQIPDRYLHIFIKRFRNILENAVDLEKSHLRWMPSLDPIYEESDDDNVIWHDDLLSAYVRLYTDLMSRLISIDPSLAKNESLMWDCTDARVFARLCIWISSRADVISGDEAGRILLDLADDVFWDAHAQRDLLIALQMRWDDYDETTRTELERRLLKGFARSDDDEYSIYRARGSLNRLHWLANRGCVFGFDLEQETQKLIIDSPEWKVEYADDADRSFQGRSGFVSQDSQYDKLQNIPLLSVLTRAKELMGKRDDWFVEHDPYSGLCKDKPIRALSALTIASKNNEYPAWAWKRFLYTDARENDTPRLLALISCRIISIPLEDLKEFVTPFVSWFRKSAKRLIEHAPTFKALWDRSICLMNAYPEACESRIGTNSEGYAWVDHAKNSPQGDLAGILMEVLSHDLKKDAGLPGEWVKNVEELLDLPNEGHRFALVKFTYNLNWFYSIDRQWTIAHLLPFLKKSDQDREAFLAGFLWSSKVSIELFKILKQYLFDLAKQNTHDNHIRKSLSSVLLLGWGNVDNATGYRPVTDSEMRDILVNADERFRLSTLWNVEHFMNERDSDWGHKTIKFIKDVWPRHIKVKSPTVSARLCSLALSNTEVFSEIVDDIIALVKGFPVGRIPLPNLKVIEQTVIAKDPEKVLDLLFNVLTEDTAYWPYNTNETLDKIVEIAPDFRNDDRLSTLRQLWND